MNNTEFIEECYRIGMQNPWCSGKAAIADGGFIVEADRLNRDSFTVFVTTEKLKETFEHGNWCLGQAFIYGDLCFMQQVDGGDEWLTMKRFEDEVVCFESISWMPSIKDDSFDSLFARLEKATKSQCKALTYRIAGYRGENMEDTHNKNKPEPETA